MILTKGFSIMANDYIPSNDTEFPRTDDATPSESLPTGRGLFKIA